jgi:hypothetical protein
LNAQPRVGRHKKLVRLRFVVVFECEEVDSCHVLLLKVDHENTVKQHNIAVALSLFNVTGKTGRGLYLKSDL